jgi:hypothetical protein
MIALLRMRDTLGASQRKEYNGIFRKQLRSNSCMPLVQGQKGGGRGRVCARGKEEWERMGVWEMIEIKVLQGLLVVPEDCYRSSVSYILLWFATHASVYLARTLNVYINNYAIWRSVSSQSLSV